jgi:alpha-L-fucosidase
MVDIYHKTIGHNCMLELDLSPGRDGLVPTAHVERYKELGDFIRSCYSAPLKPMKTVDKCDTGVYGMFFERPTSIDRIQLMEDQRNGQVIRSYGVYAKLASNDDKTWTLLSNGTSVGHKKIDLFDDVVSITAIKVNSTYVDTPKWRSISVHLCDRY